MKRSTFRQTIIHSGPVRKVAGQIVVTMAYNKLSFEDASAQAYHMIETFAEEKLFE